MKNDVFLARERLADGGLTQGRLRWNYSAMFPGVYTPKSTALDLETRITGAWLWSGREAIIAGRAAAFLHGAKWINVSTPIELIGSKSRPPGGIIVRNERIDSSELMSISGMLVTNHARTAFDMARQLPRHHAVRHLDALLAATGMRPSDALALISRYPRARGIRRCEATIDLADGGAQSPRETWLRLLFVDAGFPRPITQIHVTDGCNDAFIDMGWQEPMIGADYDGELHQTDRPRFVHDIGRNELIERRGWLDLHVVKEHSRAFIVHRFADAFARRGHPLSLRQWS